jgi:hypothetical protein
MMFDHRDALERRYDGPIPPADPATNPAAAPLRARLFQRMAEDTRAQAASHRRRLPAQAALADARLDRLQRDLHLSRSLGVAWRSR